MFLWMFIEGLYLHNVVTVTVFQGRFPHVIYAAIGWGSPVIMTVRKTNCGMSRFDKTAIVAGNLGGFHSELDAEPEMLVWLQLDALLLDTGRTSSNCYFSKQMQQCVSNSIVFIHLLPAKLYISTKHH